MRVTRDAQASIFDFYSEHQHGKQLKAQSELLAQHPEILTFIKKDFDKKDVAETGARGLSLESTSRCLLLKQILCVSYRELAFHLSHSQSYRSFARLKANHSPRHSSLQATIRRVSPETIEKINLFLLKAWIDQDTLKANTLRIDSTVVKSNILKPRDSQLLDDGVRVLSRLMSKTKQRTGVKIRFVDQRKS